MRCSALCSHAPSILHVLLLPPMLHLLALGIYAPLPKEHMYLYIYLCFAHLSNCLCIISSVHSTLLTPSPPRQGGIIAELILFLPIHLNTNIFVNRKAQISRC
jgi:hypothetical protein